MSPISALFLFLLILLIVFFALNTSPVSVNFLIIDQEISLALVIILSTLIGFVLGLIMPRLLRRESEHVELPENRARIAEELNRAE